MAGRGNRGRIIGSEQDGAEERTLVTVTLIIPAGVPAFENGTAYISLEDVTYADALSETVTEKIVSGVSHANGDKNTNMSIDLYVPTDGGIINARHDYAVQTWITCASDGLLRKGDLVSDQVYRVLTGGFGSTVTIILKQI